ncbi:hypothetical protein GCM10009808_24310 [Microbacterium sediminicola]|uniref:Cupin type-2 domain-containing protein n=1 Tax=Microbacterium sediminicola TaxID=415210 RepID=A0ABP4UH04_9MICO
MAEKPLLKDISALPAYRITPQDTVRLVPLTGPDDKSPTSVFVEIWDPEGRQPDNSHPESVEIFVFLKGEGVAQSDEHSAPVKAGDVLVLPEGSVHHITNTSSSERLYALTVMANDLGSQPEESDMPGFHALVTAGIEVELDEADLAVIGAHATTVAKYVS